MVIREIAITGSRRLTTADLQRAGALPREIEQSAQAIVDDVRERGDAAVRDYCLRFDGACPDSFLVPRSVVEGALDMVDEEFLEALRLAQAVAAAQSTAERFAADPKDVSMVEEADGGLTVVTEITRSETAAGMLYRAVISVYEGSPAMDAGAGGHATPTEGGDAGFGEAEPLYRIRTAVYRGGGAA